MGKNWRGKKEEEDLIKDFIIWMYEILKQTKKKQHIRNKENEIIDLIYYPLSPSALALVIPPNGE